MLAERSWYTRYTREDGDLIEKFYVPLLRDAIRYDRTTGYFNAQALTLAARGIEGLLRNGGTMRLVVGCTLDEKEIAAIRRGEDPQKRAALRLAASPLDPADAESTDALELLAWMVANRHLEVKVAVPCDAAGRPSPDDSIFHEKTGLVEDEDGNRLAWSGSLNETRAGWRDNWEGFMVFRSWREAAQVDVLDRNFTTLWEGRTKRALVMGVPQAVRNDLFRYLPDEGRPPKRLEESAPEPAPAPPAPPPKPAPAKPALSPEARRALVWGFLRDLPGRERTEALGEATAAVTPWPHQARAFDRLWGRWPPRLLIADEVGLGKTIQAGMLLRQAWLGGRAKRILILAPKAVLGQWRVELREKFNLNWPVYDGRYLVREASPALPDEDGRREVGAEGWVDEPAVIASSQLFWREERAAVLRAAPRYDLIVLDEAHHARRRSAGSKKARYPNRLLGLMDELRDRADGLLLLTATPMQVDAVELWDLLSLLGLPDEWSADAFVRFFEDAAQPNPDRETLARMARLFRSAEGEWGRADRKEVQRRTGLGVIRAKKVLDRLRDAEASGPLGDLSLDERRAAVRVMIDGSPARRLISRNTRELLRRYAAAGADIRIARRRVDDRFVTLPPEQDEAYRAVERYISETYDRARKADRAAVGFVMTIYRRRLASSFRALRATLERRAAALRGEAAPGGESWIEEDLPDDDLDPEAADADEAARLAKRALDREEVTAIEELLLRVRSLPRDAKFAELLRALEGLRSDGYAQVMVFTQFTDTMDFLREELAGEGGGLRLMCFSGRGGEVPEAGGGWRAVSRSEVKERFRKGQAEVLLCTDAAAEGLNFQFCGAVVNYDLPWNPMRVEQRIGRLDRVGQEKEVIRIENLHYEDTVETVVYRVLRQRIGLFEHFVGSLQPILARLPGRIRDAAFAPGGGGASSARAAQVAAELEQAADESKRAPGGGAVSASGRPDLDAAGEDELRLPERPPSPVTLDDLDRILRWPDLLPPGWGVRRLGDREYALLAPGRAGEVRVTTDPAYYDEHPGSVELWSPGGLLFPTGPDAPPGAPTEEVRRYPTLKSILDA